ncbi:MAG: hypothetical protein AB8B70_03905 [Prochlorococcus sp.]
MKHNIGILLTSFAVLALVQQQLLLRRPPRLLSPTPQPLQSGSAALDLRFSRPMQRGSVAAASQLQPDLPHRWQGENNLLRLVIDANQKIKSSIQLTVAGQDHRGQALPPQRWWWDPRPWLLVNRKVDGGDQLQLQARDGRWTPLGPTLNQIQRVVPLGNGKGAAVIETDKDWKQRLFLLPLLPRNISADRDQLASPKAGDLMPLVPGQYLFADLSSNLNGDLLAQTGGFSPGSGRTELIKADGQRRLLEIKSSGPIHLLPAGGGAVVPTFNGLTLRPLIDNGRPPQILPGARDLGDFCQATGRAVLIRHWPDYRRSIELVIPGLSPKQLWLGEESVMALSCDNSGERIWAVLGRWQDRSSQHEIVLLDGDGNLLRRRPLAPWTLKPGSKLQFDSVGEQLLMTVSKAGSDAGRPALMQATTLEWLEVLPISINDALWLPAG